MKYFSTIETFFQILRMRESGIFEMIKLSEREARHCVLVERDVSLGIDKLFSIFGLIGLSSLFSFCLLILELVSRRTSHKEHFLTPLKV